MTTEALTRRNFLFYGGATLAGVTLGEFGRRQLARADDQAATWRPTATERWAVSVCRECPAACGIRVRVVHDVPVKFEGNPLCPISRGRLCAKGQAAVESFADPDRLVGPARRVGARGEGRWEPISWDTATGLLAARVRDSAGRAGEIAAIAAEERGPVADAWARFWTATGASLQWTPTATASRLRDRFEVITGLAADPHFDVAHATYVLSFGAPLVEDWLSPLWAQRAYGHFRRGNGRTRGRLVQVDNRRSMTARKADEWIAVPVERQAVLAYGLMAVLLRERRIDATAFDAVAGNLDEFGRAVIERFTPDEVTSVTGVPVVTILRLARDLIATQQPLVIVGADADPGLMDAVLALNALLGAFDRPGGLFAADPPLVEAPVDSTRPGTPPRIVALHDASALRALATTAHTEGLLRRADFVVSFSPFLDEAADAADLLLPTHTALESWHAVVPAPAVPGQMIALARPLVTPRLNTRDLVATLHAVASSAGSPFSDAFPHNSTEELVAAMLDQLALARRGGPYVSAYESEWIQQLEHGGWWTSSISSPDDFTTTVLSVGGWADPYFEPGQIRRHLRDRGGLRFVPPAIAAPSPPAETERAPSEFTLKLRPFVPALVNQCGNPNHPVLFELLGQPESRPWSGWVEISPETARASGITAGARVRIESENGSIEAEAVLVEGMPPETAAAAFVPAVPRGGRWAREMTVDLRRLWATGAALTGTVAVRITRA